MAGEFDFVPLPDEVVDWIGEDDLPFYSGTDGVEWSDARLDAAVGTAPAPVVAALARELRASRAALRKVEPLLGEVHALGCGAHYCRYCPAQSPEWEHTPHCPYVESQKTAEVARALRQEIRALVAYVGGGGK